MNTTFYMSSNDTGVIMNYKLVDSITYIFDMNKI